MSVKKLPYPLYPLSKYRLILACVVPVALVLAFIDYRLTVLPLIIIAGMSLLGPFIQRLSLFLPIVTNGDREKRAISLTFDDGPDPESTEVLLDLLLKYDVKATFFVIGRQVEKYPDLMEKIIANGHEIGNHSQTHDIFLTLRRSDTLRKEIEVCQKSLSRLGIRSYAFRPPVGITNPKLFKVLLSLGMYCAGFSCRPVDFGNRRIFNLKEKVLKSIKPGDILMLHDRKPPGKATVKQWLFDVEEILAGMATKNIGIIPLSTLIKRPVMEFVSPIESDTANPLENIYRFFTSELDSKEETAQRNSHIAELLKFCEEQHSALELFAGSGCYTVPISTHVKNVIALEPSRRLVEKFNQKIKADNISNIKPIQGMVSDLIPNTEFDLIYSFACFRYVNDLKSLFHTLRKHLKNDGVLFLTLPEYSVSQLSRQLGNSLRNGVWYRSWRAGTIRKFLSDSGYSVLSLTRYHENSRDNKSNLLQIVARKKTC